MESNFTANVTLTSISRMGLAPTSVVSIFPASLGNPKRVIGWCKYKLPRGISRIDLITGLLVKIPGSGGNHSLIAFYANFKCSYLLATYRSGVQTEQNRSCTIRFPVTQSRGKVEFCLLRAGLVCWLQFVTVTRHF